MKLVRIMAIAALAAGVSTAAQAGGYSFQSISGNFGKFAYGDAAANGDAKVSGNNSGYTLSDSYAETTTKKNRPYGGKKKTSSASYGGNYSEFKTDYGSGTAQSHSGAVASSGVGVGVGFKIGNFEPKGRNFKPKDHMPSQ